MDPDNEWPKQKRKPPPKKKRRPISTLPGQHVKAPRFSVPALAPKGRLKNRLDSSLDHMCLPCEGPGVQERHCQLHRFPANQTKMTKEPADARKGVVTCKACSINLCVWCYAMQHRVEHLEEEIDRILSFK